MIEKQISIEEGMSDRDGWCGRTSWEPQVQTTVMTSKQSSKKPSKSSKKMPLFLDLRQENGQPQDASWQTDLVSLGECMTHSTLVSLKDAGGYVYWLTSTDNPHQTYCLNCGEKPLEPRLSKLSQILETNPDPKYKLSARACQGILNRAERRGKTLPPILKEALENQAKE